MANTYASDLAKGLSRLQKAMLVYLAEETDRMLELGYYKAKGPPVWLAWRRGHSFYGGVPPLWRAFGSTAHYTAKERAAVSRSLTRLGQRGLVDVLVQEGQRRAWSVSLTAKGLETAAALREQGASSGYRDLGPEGLMDVREMCYGLLAEQGIAAEDVPELARMIEKEPGRALQAIWRAMPKVRALRQDANRFEQEEQYAKGE